jgi:hypothetical protein
MLAADYAFAAALVVIVGCNLYFSPRIAGDKVAMQWGLDGKPTWYAPKWLAMWGAIAFMLVVRLFIWASMTYTPQYVHGAELGVLIFSMVMVVTQIYVLGQAANRE